MTSSKDNPLVSVILPVYNCERYLSDALNSIISQTYNHFEIILVNDGSTDRSREIAMQFKQRIRYHYQANAGIGAARNAGVDMASGSFLAFLDADDIWPAEKIALQLAVFRSNTDLDVAFGHVRQFISPELPSDMKGRLRCPQEAMPGRLPGAMLVRRESFFRVGYFSRAIGEALDWILRAEDLGLKTKMLSDVVLHRRLHSTNSVLLNPDIRRDYVRCLKSALDRRRKEMK
jgi:glycosyltransferase involved in cell wall biosynthesis